MAQPPDVSSDDVLRAIEKFDKDGHEKTIARYKGRGYREARDYFVNLGADRYYDSKLLVALAVEIRDGRLPENNWSGGVNHVVRRLRKLGFTVTEPLDWTEDELTVVCDVVAKSGWKELRAEYSEAIELSGIVRRVSRHPKHLRGPNFRTPGSISRKSSDLVTAREGYSGRPTRGSKLDPVIVQRFLEEPEVMSARARALREAAARDEDITLTDLDLDDPADEGGLLERRHLARERDPRIRQRKLDDVLKRGGVIRCEVCAFDFEKTYGERGRHYIEVHHRTPLHVSGPAQTRLSDLALLCSNCHRMIHRGPGWLTTMQLVQLVAAGRTDA